MNTWYIFFKCWSRLPLYAANATHKQYTYVRTYIVRRLICTIAARRFILGNGRVTVIYNFHITFRLFCIALSDRSWLTIHFNKNGWKGRLNFDIEIECRFVNNVAWRYTARRPGHGLRCRFIPLSSAAALLCLYRSRLCSVTVSNVCFTFKSNNTSKSLYEMIDW